MTGPIVTSESGKMESTHHYAELDTPDTNPATRLDFKDVGETEDFQSDTDWYKTHKRTYYQYLSDLNRGIVNLKWRNGPYYTYERTQHKTEIMASQLELTGGQKSMAEKWARRIDLQKLGVNVEISLYSICAYLVHGDENDVRECHPGTNYSDLPSEFQRMLNGGLISKERSLFASIYGKIAWIIRNWSSEDEPAVEKMDKYGIAEQKRGVNVRGEGGGI